MERVAACVWRISPELVVALDGRFGPPVDAYVNGSQTWLRDDGPGGTTVEWRLHPVAGFTRPPEVGTHDLFEVVALAVGTGGEPPAPPEALWDGLEAFPAHPEEGEVEPARLAEACTESLGIPPDASGMLDHDALGDAWERAGGNFSIIDAALTQLAG